MSGDITYRPGAPLAEIRLDQPERRNAISFAMWEGLKRAVDEAAKDDRARAVVVRGEGGHFAAGADISEFETLLTSDANAERFAQVMLESLAALEALAKPTVAAIRGACVGGGLSIALACDVRFAARSMRMGAAPGKLGLVYSLADTRRLAAACGPSAARDLLFTGRLIEAEEALSLRLIDRLVSDDALDDAVLGFARLVEETSPASARATKEMFSLLRDKVADDHPRARRLLIEAFTGADFKEGRKAFLEKRRPRFLPNP